MTDRIYERAAALCNPSELLMLDALLRNRPASFDRDVPGNVLIDHPHLLIVPQHHSSRTGRYRLDFAVIASLPCMERIKIDVECDGHEWHERTKHQVMRDNLRTQHLKGLGWLVERFSGAQIYADADQCARRVYCAIDDEAGKLILAGAEARWWPWLKRAA